MEARTYPIYEQVGDVLLIGTNHDQVPSEDERQTLTKVIGEAQHVFVEGASATFWKTPNVDMLARELAGAKIHYLEQGANYLDVLEKRGLEKNLAAVHFALVLAEIYRVERKTYVSTTEMGDLMERFMKPYLKESVESRCMGNMDVDFAISKAKRLQSLVTPQGVSSYFKYLMRARDVEYLIPNLLNGSALEGKKVAVTGYNHMPHLSNALRGDILQLPRWPEYVASLPYGCKEELAFIEMEVNA